MTTGDTRRQESGDSRAQAARSSDGSDGDPFARAGMSFDDIRQKGITEIYCLGDIIGYGPNPCECLDAVMRCCELTILGNHDQAALFDPDAIFADISRDIVRKKRILLPYLRNDDPFFTHRELGCILYGKHHPDEQR